MEYQGISSGSPQILNFPLSFIIGQKLDTDEWNIRASAAAHPKWCGTSHSGLQSDIEHNLMILRFFGGKHFTAIWSTWVPYFDLVRSRGGEADQDMCTHCCLAGTLHEERGRNFRLLSKMDTGRISWLLLVLTLLSGVAILTCIWLSILIHAKVWYSDWIVDSVRGGHGVVGRMAD